MRRAALSLLATVIGLVLLLNFKTHSGSTALLRPAAIATPQPTATAGGTTSSGTTPLTTTVTGDTYDTRYGPVQVQITLTAGKLTDVAAVQLPQNSERDMEIDNDAVPQLRQEALAAQSAEIDYVSGATYTSEGYVQSLQSALDKARAR